VASSFDWWVESTLEARRMRKLTGKAVAILMKSYLVRPFNTWVDEVYDARRFRKLTGKAAALLFSRTAAHSFLTWRRYVEQEQWERDVMRRVRSLPTTVLIGGRGRTSLAGLCRYTGTRRPLFSLVQ
jgi:hypothetical protein